MKRIASALGLLLVALGASIAAGAGGDDDGYRVDVIFDNASNVIPGQDVKVAGARAGRIVAVSLTPDHKARVTMEVSEEFAPFRADADCTIQPQSLIGEKFVQCSPGTPAAPPLRGRGDAPPTLPATRTHAPVDLDLVFATFRLPYRQRVALIVNELGGGLAGRGEDLNVLIRRANPALAEANRVLAILDRDRTRLGRLVEESDAIVARLAARRERVADFLDQAARVTETTARRESGLRTTVRRLPPLLAEADPTLDRLGALARAGEPLLRGLERSAPGLERLVGALPPLSDAARPALDRLGEMAVTGRATVRDGRRPVALLRRFARAARPTGALVNQLFQSMRRRGVVEGLQTFTYFAALATSRFDSVSHIIPAHLITTECQQYATEPVAGCSARWGGGGAARAGQDGGPRAGPGEERTPADERDGAGRGTRPPAPSSTVPGAPASPGGHGGPVPGLPPLVELPAAPGGGRPPAGGEPAPGGSVQDVLDYLLGD